MDHEMAMATLLAPEAINAVLEIRGVRPYQTNFQKSTFDTNLRIPPALQDKYFYVAKKQYAHLIQGYPGTISNDFVITNLPNTLAFIPTNSIYKYMTSMLYGLPDYFHIKIGTTSPVGVAPTLAARTPPELPGFPRAFVERSASNYVRSNTLLMNIETTAPPANGPVPPASEPLIPNRTDPPAQVVNELIRFEDNNSADRLLDVISVQPYPV